MLLCHCCSFIFFSAILSVTVIIANSLGQQGIQSRSQSIFIHAWGPLVARKWANHRLMPCSTEHPGRIIPVHSNSCVTAIHYRKYTQWTLTSLIGKKKHGRKWFSTCYWSPFGIILVIPFGFTLPLWKPCSEEGVWGVGDLSHRYGGRCRHVPSVKQVGALQLDKQRGTNLNLLWFLLILPILKDNEDGRKIGTSRKDLGGRSFMGAPKSQQELCWGYFFLSINGISLRPSPSGCIVVFLAAIISYLSLPRLCTGNTGGCLPGGDCRLHHCSLAQLLAFAILLFWPI